MFQVFRKLNPGPGNRPINENDMLVKITHPVTGKIKMVEMTEYEYQAAKILFPNLTWIDEPRPDHTAEKAIKD